MVFRRVVTGVESLVVRESPWAVHVAKCWAEGSHCWLKKKGTKKMSRERRREKKIKKREKGGC